MTSTLVYAATDPRLGRYVRHDEASRAYDLASAVASSLPTEPIRWERHGPILDQGDVGACTACAALGLMMTNPFSTGATYTMDDVLAFYSEETRIDGIRGVYPPTDTGSSGIAAMKALKRRGLIRQYMHAFSPVVTVSALRRGPVAIGSVWLRSMFEPRHGQIVVDWRSPVEGGHEYLLTGWNPRSRRVEVTNSWGTFWGDEGRSLLAYDDLAALLRQQGDAVQPTI